VSAGNVLIVGVGGQGVLLASELLAEVALACGLKATKSDVHGMAQRGGVVYSHVRWGDSVESPTIERGRADALVAMEWAEALRWVSFVKPNGVVIADGSRIVPPAACSDRGSFRSLYPEAGLQPLGRDLYVADATEVARSAGAVRAANVVLLGCLSLALDFPEALWQQAIRGHVPPKAVEANLRAFERGRSIPRAPAAAPPTPPARRELAFEYSIDVLDAWCKGCDICVRVCPESCLRLNGDKIVRLFEDRRCTGCYLCERLCPDFAIAVRRVEVALHG
jgi:indolepyruvate ferredoxin oxidoreductase beta subunit